MEKILVTGCAGFVAHHLVKALKARGYEVFGVDDLSNGTKEYTKLCDYFECKKAGDIYKGQLYGVKWIFHLAALPRVPYSIEHPKETHEANVNETLKLLLTAKEAGVEKFIFSSSSAVYGEQDEFPTPETAKTRPLSPYALQKFTAEQYCELFRSLYGFPTVSLRYFNVYGEEQRADNPYTGVLTRFFDLRKEGKPLTIYGTGEQRRDFTYVGDIVAANILTAEKGSGVYNVGTGRNHSIIEIAQKISSDITFHEARPGDPPLSLADSSRLQELGWEPTKELSDWIAEHP